MSNTPIVTPWPAHMTPPAHGTKWKRPSRGSGTLTRFQCAAQDCPKAGQWQPWWEFGKDRGALFTSRCRACERRRHLTDAAKTRRRARDSKYAARVRELLAFARSQS